MKSLLYSIFCFSLISCNSNVTYSSFDKNFNANRWQKSDAKQFNFTISDSTATYNLILKFSHVYDFQFANVPLKISIKNPNRTIEDTIMNLKIKDSNGKEIGDCSGDICDVSQTIKSKIKLQNGRYTVSIQNQFLGNYLPNVLGIGLEVEKTE